MPRASLGDFEHQVLLAILRLGGEAYSVSVVQEIEVSTDRTVSQAAVFIALQRLERRGLVVSRMERPEGPGDARRVRRYFRLTDPAIAQLRETREIFSRLWAGIESELDEGSSR
jgi:DNA-binding PadR family transcriptional regulator